MNDRMQINFGKYLLILFLTSSLYAHAQFKFTTEKTDEGEWVTSMNDAEWIDASNAMFWAVQHYNVDGGIFELKMYIIGKDQCELVNRQCTEIDENGEKVAKKRQTVLELSNGERLSFVDDVINEDGEKVENLHAFSLHFGLVFASSSRVDLEDVDDIEAENYVIRQLCNYDIVGFSVLGQNFTVTKIRTSPTLNSMFGELSRKTGRSYGVTSNGPQMTNVSAEFRRAWLEYNVYEDGEKGMRIHADFNVNNAYGKTVMLQCFFFDSYEKPLVDFNNRYVSYSGQVMTETRFVPKYENTTFTDVTTFIPYSELHLLSGTHDLECRPCIFYNNSKYAEAKALRFTMDTP